MKYLGMFLKYIGIFCDAIKFEHTLFALPFAYLGAFLGHHGFPGWEILFWMTLAMIGARTSGMSLNRIIDAEIDKKNPRTANRALPQRILSKKFMWLVVIISILILEYSAFKLNPLCFLLSPLALILLFTYSYTKRFTWLSHIVLGIIIACAPIGGWIASTGRLEFPVVLVGVAVVFWLAGLDIIYACQDYEFDVKEKLFSIPAKFGIPFALFLSAIFHVITFMILISAGWLMGLSFWYFTGCILCGLLLYYQHSIISPKDLSRLNTAFFTANASLSIILLVFTLLGLR